MAHYSEIKVRGFHLDVYQHVNNARYLEFLEEARWAYLEDSGDIEHFQSLGLAWVIVNINISYRAGAHLGQHLVISSKLIKVGDKSAVFRQQITIKGTDIVVVDADITFVMMDQKTQKAVPIIGDVKTRLEQHLQEED